MSRTNYLVTVTDTFGNDVNYGWVRKYNVQATTELAAIRLVSRQHGYKGFRRSYESWDHVRYDLRSCNICAFVEPVTEGAEA